MAANPSNVQVAHRQAERPIGGSSVESDSRKLLSADQRLDAPGFSGRHPGPRDSLPLSNLLEQGIDRRAFRPAFTFYPKVFVNVPHAATST